MKADNLSEFVFVRARLCPIKSSIVVDYFPSRNMGRGQERMKADNLSESVLVCSRLCPIKSSVLVDCSYCTRAISSASCNVRAPITSISSGKDSAPLRCKVPLGTRARLKPSLVAS